jgi:hypothetical protein
MRYALVESGVVVNVVEVVEGDGSTAQEGQALVPSDTANIGDLWDGSAFQKPAP